MKILKRFWSGVSTQMEAVVRMMEDSESLADAHLEDARRSYGVAVSRVDRMRREIAQLREQRDKAQVAVAQWTERAKAAREQDEGRAIECLRRRRESHHEAERLSALLITQEEVIERLTGELQMMRSALVDLELRRRELRARAAASEAREVLEIYPGGPSPLDRLEEQLAAAEVYLAHAGERIEDQFAREYRKQEERSALAAELAAL